MRIAGQHPVKACPRTKAFAAATSLVALLGGCMMIGPDYEPPPAPTAESWRDASEDGAIRGDGAVDEAWWRVFDDPVLDSLIEQAYQQNPSLHAAGARVLEAVARRGIAVGTLFPQQQEAFGAYLRNQLSENRANQSAADLKFDDWQVGFDAAWELDVWGRLRRGIEAAEADALASVASYDDVLVSLIAEVARNYIQLRTLEEQLAVAESNVAIQERSFEIVDAKFRGGAVTELDSAQAASLLEDTRSLIPDFEARIRANENTLCILIGIPPRDLRDILGDRQPRGAGANGIPGARREVAVGIPAELLRRRPDVRRAERELASQSAQIGIAKADLLPRFQLVGQISLAAEDFADLFQGGSFEGFGGPTFRWAILNYGRIANNIRVQDARYQSLIGTYEETVLRAQAEVENAIAGFVGAERQVVFLDRSVRAAARAVELADLQYREGAVDYTRVILAQQFLLDEQNRLVATRGLVALNLTSLYKALGGGWEVRIGDGFVTEEAAEQMRGRTRWGGLVETKGQAERIEAAGSGTEAARGWWRWRWWWPQW